MMGRMSTREPTIEIDARRFWSTVMRSGQIGPGKAGGLRRLALTDADKEMRDLFVTWCTEAGCTITVDRVGNIFARRPGRDDHLPPVLMGSHLDTQVAGGKYDGIVGVLAGLEVLRTLDARRVATRRPLELVCWTNEEGARFTPPMVASGAFASVFDVDWVLALRDDDGKVFGSELERIGYDGKTAVGGRGIDAYFELHIEQGPILDRGGGAGRDRGRRLRHARHARGCPRRDRPRGADADGPPAQRPSGRRDAGGRRQRGRLEVPRHRGQGHGGPHGGLAQQGRASSPSMRS